MSDSLALVRFPDGELRVAYYFGSIDMVVPPLYDLSEADAVLAAGFEAVIERLQELEEKGSPDPGDVEDVQVWSDYGAGAHWRGRASRGSGMLVEGSIPTGWERRRVLRQSLPVR